MRGLIKQTGVTLVEVVIFIIIVGIAVAAITLQFSQNVRHSADPLIRQKAITLANAYLDEMSKRAWNENTPSGGGCVETDSNYCIDYCDSITQKSACDATNMCIYNNPLSTCEPRNNAAVLGAEEASRSAYDDIDDYITAATAPTDANGNALTGFNNFTIAISVTQPAANWNGINFNDVRKIDVTVNTPTNESLSFTQYRVNF